MMSKSIIQIPVRHYRHYVDLDKPNDEAHLAFDEKTFDLPVAETALVLVDCWNNHHNDGWKNRAVQVMKDKIVPVLAAARQKGLTICHCPSTEVACRYPLWTRYADDTDLELRPPAEKDGPLAWPPEEFRKTEGKYASFAASPATRTVEVWTGIHESVAPRESETEFVVGTGAQLHRLCAHRKILHLVYVGFATNMCIMFRDYGVRAMGAKGYNIILLRDCTTGFESHDTVKDLLQTNMSIREIEVQVGWSAISTNFIEACT